MSFPPLEYGRRSHDERGDGLGDIGPRRHAGFEANACVQGIRRRDAFRFASIQDIDSIVETVYQSPFLRRDQP
jgi:hypothetical protein